MLIDSDLPIFGSGETRRPCISLRLRDARSPPINVLTGLDYWLDNLMSNVPEVAMCYHVNGFVQVKLIMWLGSNCVELFLGVLICIFKNSLKLYNIKF